MYMRKIAPSQPLLTGWQLAHDAKNMGRDEQWYLGIPKENAVDAYVPSFVHLFLPNCQGVAWYEKRFVTQLAPDADYAVQLHFGMADWLCEVYLNGELLGTHRGTENPFSFDASEYLLPAGEENLLCVRVSKPYEEDVDGYDFWQIPHRNQDPKGLRPGWCYNEYGLSGEVKLVRAPRLRIEDLYLYGNSETSCIEARCTVVNDYDRPVEGQLLLLAGEQREGCAQAEDVFSFTAPCGETEILRKIPIAHVKLWDLDDPNLYVMEAMVSAGNTMHAVNKRCGFRTFEVRKDGYFYLNGRRIFLRCSHTGNCMPESTHHIVRDKALLRKDFVMAKSTGFNMVRFISGGALPEQLDYCDELGLMVYEEPVSSWLQQDGEHAKEFYEYDLFTLVKRDRSHPCVTVWGLLNETYAIPPYGDCCKVAREVLPALRDLDETRLVLFSSGRWDKDLSTGSLSNPYSRKWECLWGAEDESLPQEPVEPIRNAGAGARTGDRHMYPAQPTTKEEMHAIRAMGHDSGRPIFFSEYGVGSLFDVIWLKRKFEEMEADERMPDVKMIRHMAKQFEDDLKLYGMDREYAFPIDIMKESHRLHNRHRSLQFDLVRSNPNFCGLSLTGLLDHSICGEGLWTLMREWKAGIADTLQEGFAPLRWCLFVSDTHLYSGKPFTVEGVLGNERVLKNRAYPIGLRIMGKEGVVYEENLTLFVTEEDTRSFAVPVFKKELSLNLPEGEYTMRAEILEGAAAFGGSLKFYVSDDARTKAAIPCVGGIGLSENEKALLERKGVKIVEAEAIDGPAVVLVGKLADEEKEEVWKRINKLTGMGCRVVLGDRFALAKRMDEDGNPAAEEELGYYWPLENKITQWPGHAKRSTDWLYHQEYLLKRNHPYFAGMKTGLMDWEYSLQLSCGAYFKEKEGCHAESVAATSFCTGWPSDDGYIGGMNLARYQTGKGALVLNSYRLLENLNINPAADRLLINILNAEYEELKKKAQ